MRLSRCWMQERRFAALVARRHVPRSDGRFITIGRISRIDCERWSMLRALAALVVAFCSAVVAGAELSPREAILFLDFRDRIPDGLNRGGAVRHIRGAFGGA